MEKYGLPLKPTLSFVEEYICKFDSLEGDGKYDQLIYNIIYKFPYNVEYNDILTKVILINRLYNTNIFNVYLMAENIMNLNIDKYLNANNYDIVKMIDQSYYKKDKTGKIKYISCYSFATKYCSFHNNLFPIYDRIIAKMLNLYNYKDKFSEFKIEELRSYDTLISVLNDFLVYYDLNNINYKNIDKFLWQYGKEFFGQ